MDGLESEGILREKVDAVILSHQHVDHISGAVDSAGKPAFPNARYFMPRGEWNELISMDIPDEENAWDGWARAILFAQNACKAIQDRVELVDPDVEILPGLRVISTPGHTANHCSFEFVSGDTRLVCPLDTLGHPIHAEQPAWHEEGEQSLASRRRILEISEGATLVHVYHFPFPGLGRVTRDGEGWCWHDIDPR